MGSKEVSWSEHVTQTKDGSDTSVFLHFGTANEILVDQENEPQARYLQQSKPKHKNNGYFERGLNTC